MFDTISTSISVRTILRLRSPPLPREERLLLPSLSRERTTSDNQRKYRFEVPPDRFDEVKSFLDDYGYTLVIVEETDTFVVVVKSIPPVQGVFLKTPSYSVVRATIIAF